MPKVPTRIDPTQLRAALTVPPGSDDVDTQILDAAATHLVEVGVTHFEVDAVVDLSGIGRSTIYRRFDDRNTLLTLGVAHLTRRLFGLLAGMTEGIGGTGERVVAGFAGGLRLARMAGLFDAVRDEPVFLRLVTVDSEPLITAGAEQLVSASLARDPDTDVEVARAGAEILVRLAISLMVAPSPLIDLDSDDLEESLRKLLAPLLPVIT